VAKTMAEEATTATTATDTAAVVGPNDSDGGGPDTVRTNARGTPDATPDPKVVGKRPTALTGSGSPSPQ
jgi:hypothetical protein